MKTLNIFLSMCGLGLSTSCSAQPQGNVQNGIPNTAPNEAQLLKFKHSAIQHSAVDGLKDDLLSAGLGIKGLSSYQAPTLSEHPSPSEIRRLAVYNNYRGIVSTDTKLGYGRLYGPSAQQASIAGDEYQSSLVYEDGSLAANVIIQVPSTFAKDTPCIIAAPSSGSRGVWGAIGTAGDWGLRQGCAVAYTDKGTGTGFQFMDTEQSYHSDGRLKGSRNVIRDDVRVKTKHAHSQKNVEKDWGHFTLQSVQMAFYLLNQHHRSGESYYTRDNTRVIATSISNGGNSVLRAGELDQNQWLDAIVASEPTVVLPRDFKYQVDSPKTPYQGEAKNILAMAIEQALLQPCAMLAETPKANSIFSPAIAATQAHLQQRCKNLKAEGLIEGHTENELATAAAAKLQALGIQSPSYSLQAFTVANQLWESIAINYSNSYAKAKMEDSLCGFDFGHAPAGPLKALPQAARQKLFGVSGGIPNTGGVQLSYQGFALSHPLTEQSKLDAHFPGLMCLARYYESNAIKTGLQDIALNGEQQAKPVIIIQGSRDSLVFPNHNGRAYIALQHSKHPKRDNIRYYEIDRGQHFDALLSFPEFAEQLVPMHIYYERALDLMWQHLESKTVLPPSQLVTTQANSPLQESDVPNWRMQAGDKAILVSGTAEKGATVTMPR